jgi:HEAT repeat protein
MLKELSIFRVIIGYLIGKIFPRIAVKKIVPMLSSENEDTRTAAYITLVKLGSKSSQELLGEARKGHESVACIQILGDQGNPEIIPELEKFQTSSDEKIATAARESIQALKDE